MIVLDANVLIAHLDAGDAHHEAATARLDEAADHEFGASSVTMAEALVAPARTGRMSDARVALQTIGLTELPLPPVAAERLAVLRAETGLKLPDCCVLLAAEDVNGPILTFDERLERVAAQRGLAYESGR